MVLAHLETVEDLFCAWLHQTIAERFKSWYILLRSLTVNDCMLESIFSFGSFTSLNIADIDVNFT